MKKIIILPLILIAFALFFRNDIAGRFFLSQKTPENKAIPAAETPPLPEKKDRLELIEITDGATFGQLMASSSVAYGLAMEIYEAVKPTYDLARVRAGRQIELTFDKDTDKLKKLAYKIDSEDELSVIRTDNETASGTASSNQEIKPGWQSSIKAIPYKLKTVAKGGTIESSMYEAALKENIDIRAIIELANAFQWSIDFAMDPRAGDTFRFVYEERYLDGAYVMPGRILAGRYTNDGKDFFVYYFEESAGNQGFFDENGHSVQKMFLKAPVEFRYISSGFTTGLRYIEAFNVSTGHRAIDYAAALGTPIRAVGDGTITFAGWSSAGYGNLTSIRHNGTYSTNYGHQSKIAVKRGQKVKQGQTIGYVGSTGFSTGPHLHYEMVKNGVKINPLSEILPPGEPIKEENQARFLELVDKYKAMLDT